MRRRRERLQPGPQVAAVATALHIGVRRDRRAGVRPGLLPGQVGGQGVLQRSVLQAVVGAEPPVRDGPLHRVAQHHQDVRLPEHGGGARGGRRVLQVAGALLAEHLLVRGVREERLVVPGVPARRLRLGQEDLRLGSPRPRHRDLGMGVEERGEVGGPAPLRTDDQQVPRQTETRCLMWYVWSELTALRVLTTYSPSMDSSAMIMPLKIESSTTSVVQPCTCASTKNDRTM